MIQLTDTWRVKTDSLNYTLQQYCEVKNRDSEGSHMDWVNRGFFWTLEQCAGAILNEEIRLCEAANIHSLIGYYPSYRKTAVCGDWEV